MRRRYLTSTGILAVLTFLSGSALAQTNTATLTGIVVDKSQAVVPHATIEIRSRETGVVKKTAVNETGQFTFNFLPPGTYDLVAEAPGFQRLDQSQLSLAAGQ